MDRVLITGSRSFTDRDKVISVLKDQYKRRGPYIIVNGRAKDGVDQIAHEFFLYKELFDVDVYEEPHFADWKPQGKSGPVDKGAGIKRNHKMVDLGADVCLAFPTICVGYKSTCSPDPHYSHGTFDCMSYAAKKLIPVENHGQVIIPD
jgi:hypothetical protein